MEKRAAGIIKSAQSEFRIEDVPEISVAEFLLQKVQTLLPELSDKPWVIDMQSGSKVYYGDVELHSRHVASALARHVGFKRGDVLFCSANECSHMYVVWLAAWRLGGVIRCCYQREQPDEVARQMRETKTCVVLMDRDTAPVLRQAASSLGWPVTLLSVGREPVPDTMHYQQLVQYDLSAFPAESVRVNVHTDVAVITSTTGSTGRPKGVMLSHFNLVCGFFIAWSKTSRDTQIADTNVDNVSNLISVMKACCNGASVILIPRHISKHDYLDVIMQYKPASVMMYPAIATWFARDAKVTQHDLSFVRTLVFIGNILNHTTLTLMDKLLPQCRFHQAYGISECAFISNTALDISSRLVKTTKNAGEIHASIGLLLPFTECKLVHLETEKTIVEPGERGEILVRSPLVMLGYITPEGEADRSKIDAEGWYHTGDIGFFDQEDFLYVTGRVNFSYRKQGYDIMPGEIEAVLLTHESVMAAGVVGIPDSEALYLTRAYVVLLEDQHVTASELQKYVAERMHVAKHLDGGVRFLPELPLNRNNKLDYKKLLEIDKKSSR